MFDPISPARHSLVVEDVRHQVSTAQARWNALGVRDYSFEMHGSSQGVCAVNALIEIQNDVVVKAQPLDALSLLPPEKWADPDWGNEIFLCDYNHFTIPRMFEMLEKTLRNSPFAILAAEFDPQYGFITHFEDGIFASHGWLNQRDRNVYNEFRIINFKVVRQVAP